MRFIAGLHKLPKQPKPCVLTIGNFDGMHRGHQLIMERLSQYAKEHKLISTVMVFEPQPREYFKPSEITPRLSLLRDKLIFLQKQHIDQVLCLAFNKKLAALSAEQFIEEILVKALNCKHLVIGDDFAFGSDRRGNFSLLEKYGRQYGFSVEHTPTILYQGERISSSRVREAISQGDFKLAVALLGRPYSISGYVQHGDKRGRLLGFPTLNLRLIKPMAVQGVYLVQAKGIGNEVRFGVANVGRRPTVDGKVQLLEVYLLDFSGDCYGKLIEVEFLDLIRLEQKFSSIEALKQQIAIDVQIAKQLINTKYLSI
ncbi:MAG: bifunctional riboflavin kinase/FAD synthetase [Gammaproteobacteria bacterium]|nr:bifunctional riboflavin kinase/FAD synthetase [Gammaproteobacteria bacterium]